LPVAAYILLHARTSSSQVVSSRRADAAYLVPEEIAAARWANLDFYGRNGPRQQLSQRSRHHSR